MADIAFENMSNDWPSAWPNDEHEIADLIAMHARTRIARGAPVSLREYLDRIPDLERKPVALDIAIESALLAATGGRGGRRDIERAGRLLASEYPNLRGAILEAATLSSLMCSTNTLRERIQSDSLPSPPCEFGPSFTRAERRFRLIGLLGMGAHGAVYLAIDRALSESDKPAQVAIKVMLREHPEGDSSAALEEGAKARRVDHPSVVRVYDAGTTDDGLEYIVSEYVAGGSLRKGPRAVSTPAPPRDAARIAAQIADGVQALHSAGLIHFDLKPDNILIADDGSPKVADLSLAVRETERLANTAGADATPGTVGFMAPEQIRGEIATLDASCDIYALGGILYWLLTGDFPNRGALTKHWTYDETNAAATHERALRDIPRDLRAIVRRALSPTPTRRHQTAAQLADDLRLFLARRPISWTRPSAARVGGMWVRRHPYLSAATLLALSASVFAGSVFIRLDRAATAKAAEAEIAAARLTSETHWKRKAGEFLQVFRINREKLIASGAIGETFGALWSTEWLLGRGFLKNPDDEAATREERLIFLQEVFAESIKDQGPNSIDVLIFGSATTYWAITLDKPEIATETIGIVRDAWRNRLDERDQWRIVIDVLDECSMVLLNLKMNLKINPDQTVERLINLQDDLDGLADAKPLKKLVTGVLETDALSSAYSQRSKARIASAAPTTPSQTEP
jgi:serine/threonine protein kinase